MGEYWFNDSKSKTYGYQIPQGQHNVEISTRWSNGFEDSNQLTFDVKEGRKYTIYTHELKKGQDPNAPVVLTEVYQEQTYKGNAGGTFLKNIGEGLLASIEMTALVIASPYIVMALPVILPAVYLYDKSTKKSKHHTADTEAQPTDSVTETVAQPPDPTLDTEIKPEDSAVANISQPVELPSAPTARPFDGCCYVWIEDFETREVVAGKRLPGAT
jgi:hypothetical protein